MGLSRRKLAMAGRTAAPNSTATETFDVTVTAVNDQPTISDVGDQAIDEDTATGALPFTVGDNETAVASLTLSGTSSNPSNFMRTQLYLRYWFDKHKRGTKTMTSASASGEGDR